MNISFNCYYAMGWDDYRASVLPLARVDHLHFDQKLYVVTEDCCHKKMSNSAYLLGMNFCKEVMKSRREEALDDKAVECACKFIHLEPAQRFKNVEQSTRSCFHCKRLEKDVILFDQCGLFGGDYYYCSVDCLIPSMRKIIMADESTAAFFGADNHRAAHVLRADELEEHVKRMVPAWVFPGTLAALTYTTTVIPTVRFETRKIVGE